MPRLKGVSGVYFCGQKISDYGIEHNRVDYATLLKSFDAVLNNTIISLPEFCDYWELENGSDYTYYDADGNEVEPGEDYENCEPVEVYTWYIISEAGAEILKDFTNEIVYYNEKLDIYLLGIQHFGTAYSNVLTEIKCNMGEAAYKNIEPAADAD